MNGCCGALSLFSTARYLLSNDKRHLWSALWFPFGGLFFDVLDGKVARWRNSASLLGQELDSLADLVRLNFSVYFGPEPAKTVTSVDFLLCRACCACVCSRFTNMVGHDHPHLLHLLWPRPSRPFQRDRRTHPKGCHGQVEILRGSPYSYYPCPCCHARFLDQKGLDRRRRGRSMGCDHIMEGQRTEWGCPYC